MVSEEQSGAKAAAVPGAVSAGASSMIFCTSSTNAGDACIASSTKGRESTSEELFFFGGGRAREFCLVFLVCVFAMLGWALPASRRVGSEVICLIHGPMRLLVLVAFGYY